MFPLPRHAFSCRPRPFRIVAPRISFCAFNYIKSKPKTTRSVAHFPSKITLEPWNRTNKHRCKASGEASICAQHFFLCMYEDVFCVPWKTIHLSRHHAAQPDMHIPVPYLTVRNRTRCTTLHMRFWHGLEFQGVRFLERSLLPGLQGFFFTVRRQRTRRVHNDDVVMVAKLNQSLFERQRLYQNHVNNWKPDKRKRIPSTPVESSYILNIHVKRSKPVERVPECTSFFFHTRRKKKSYAH